MFSKKKLPENGGNHPLENADSSNYVDKYYLVFNGMEGEPTYELEASVTIGSGDTNIVLDLLAKPKNEKELSLKGVSLLNLSSISVYN